MIRTVILALLALAPLGVARADAPPLPALLTEAAIGDQSLRLVTSGAGAVADEAEGSFVGTVEGAFRSRLALAVRVSGATGEATPELGGELRVGLLGPDAPVDLAVGSRYTRAGFVPGTDEIEGFAALGADLGDWRLLVNAVGGHALAADEGDVEAGVTGTRRFGEHLRAGAGARGRKAFGEEEQWEEEREEEGREGDLVGGLIVGYDVGPFSAVALVGGRTVFEHEGVSPGGYGHLGAQLAF